MARAKSVLTEKQNAKVTEKPEVKTGKVETKTVEQPVKKVKRTVNRDEVVICRSVFDGTLCYTNPRTGESWCWNYGDEHEMTVGDLLTMSGNNKIFLTAPWIIVDAEEDIVKAFEMGASDYITKPFRTLELIARLNRILNKKTIKVKDITFDMNKMVVYKNDKVVNLTSLELKILNMIRRL